MQGKIFADAYFALSYSYLEPFSSIIDVLSFDRLTGPGLTEAYNSIKWKTNGTRALSGATPKTAAADAGTLVNPEALAGAAAAGAVALELVLTVFAGLEIVVIGQAALCIRSMQLVCADYEKYDAAVAAREATAAELEGIAKRYGYGDCQKAAEAMKVYLTEKKENGAIITLTWIPYDDRVRYLWSDLKGDAGTQPIHVGILYKGKVYCNIHPQGLPMDAWINDFNYPGVKLPPIITPF